jgi:hypothetical protein
VSYVSIDMGGEFEGQREEGWLAPMVSSIPASTSSSCIIMQRHLIKSTT